MAQLVGCENETALESFEQSMAGCLDDCLQKEQARITALNSAVEHLTQNVESLHLAWKTFRSMQTHAAREKKRRWRHVHSFLAYFGLSGKRRSHQ